MSAPRLLLALDVLTVLRRPLSELRGFAHPDGRPMTPRAVRDALAEELAAGRELLPIGAPKTPI